MMSRLKTLPIRLDPATYLRLRRQAQSEGRSMNELMLAALHHSIWKQIPFRGSACGNSRVRSLRKIRNFLRP